MWNLKKLELKDSKLVVGRDGSGVRGGGEMDEVVKRYNFLVSK